MELHLLTQKDRTYEWNGPILALWPTKSLMDTIDSLKGENDVLMVPWTLEEVQFWIDTWNARELGTDDSATAPRRINTAVEIALERLDSIVNKSTGILHPSDRKTAIETFTKLRNNGTPFNPEEVRAWLIRESGWEPRHADDVSRVAKAVLEGRRLR